MTQLFSLLSQVFAHQSKSNDLEHYINSHQPNSNQQLEELARNYLYGYSNPRGLQS